MEKLWNMKNRQKVMDFWDHGVLPLNLLEFFWNTERKVLLISDIEVVNWPLLMNWPIL